MKNTQKIAIWYAKRERQLKRQKEYIANNGLEADFKASKYKNMTWFLRSKGVSI